jgi:hypothetical protein
MYKFYRFFIFGFGMFLLLIVSCSKTTVVNLPNSSNNDSLMTPSVQYEFDGGTGHYTYSPSPIEMQDKSRYIFVCENEDPFIIRDHIYLYKGIPLGNEYTWNQGKLMLSPTQNTWDSVHCCDPCVREFSLKYKNEQYNWIMTYLGCDRFDCNHNQIGLAFAKNIDGPYIKYDKNPLIASYDQTQWGVGQTSIIVKDSTTIELFYTSSISGTSLRERDIKLNILDSINIGEENIVSSLGLGAADADIAFSNDKAFAVLPLENPAANSVPPVCETTRLLCIPLTENIFSATNNWKLIGYISPENSGFPRNHNARLLTDPKGYIMSNDTLIVYFSVSSTSSDWLWTYHIYSAVFNNKINY